MMLWYDDIFVGMNNMLVLGNSHRVISDWYSLRRRSSRSSSIAALGSA